jgi:hypothetical protein
MASNLFDENSNDPFANFDSTSIGYVYLGIYRRVSKLPMTNYPQHRINNLQNDNLPPNRLILSWMYSCRLIATIPGRRSPPPGTILRIDEMRDDYILAEVDDNQQFSQKFIIPRMEFNIGFPTCFRRIQFPLQPIVPNVSYIEYKYMPIVRIENLNRYPFKSRKFLKTNK